MLHIKRGAKNFTKNWSGTLNISQFQAKYSHLSTLSLWIVPRLSLKELSQHSFKIFWCKSDVFWWIFSTLNHRPKQWDFSETGQKLKHKILLRTQIVGWKICMQAIGPQQLPASKTHVIRCRELSTEIASDESLRTACWTFWTCLSPLPLTHQLCCYYPSS